MSNLKKDVEDNRLAIVDTENWTNAGLGLKKDIKDYRLAIIDNRLALEIIDSLLKIIYQLFIIINQLLESIKKYI